MDPGREVIRPYGRALGALAQEADLSQYGPDPKLPAPYRGLLPTMKIANLRHGTSAGRGPRRATP